MATHFLADVHLTGDHDPKAARLQAYLRGPARSADAVYLLGDIFDVWIGDDGSLAHHAETLAQFARLREAGVPAYFMCGNRDFAVGERFFRRTGLVSLADPCAIDLYGTTTALTHGDSLCTGDLAQQRFRARYTDPSWRARMARLPLFTRRLIGFWARQRRPRRAARRDPARLDVDPLAARALMARFEATRLIHGHTHRPADHPMDSDRTRPPRQFRHVIGDWRPRRSEMLVVTGAGVQRCEALSIGRG